MLNPKHLNTFLTLVDTGHFTKTAEKLFMTQPGVTQHIHKLEQACGYLLIRRVNKSFELTEQGEQVCRYAKQLVKNEKQLMEALNFDDPYKGDYKIACSGALALNLFPLLLNLQVQHKELVMHLKAAPNHQILDEVRDGIIDIGIVTQLTNPTLYDAHKLGADQLCLVIPADAPVNKDCSDLLCELGLIAHPDAEHYLSLYFSQCQDYSLKKLNIKDIKVTGYINQIGQILQPVAKGLGFTILPESAVEGFSERNLIQVFQPAEKVEEQLFLVKKRNRDLPERFTTVNRILAELFKN